MFLAIESSGGIRKLFAPQSLISSYEPIVGEVSVVRRRVAFARFHQESTVSIQQITAEEAHTLITQDTSVIYLDVRTVPEFEAGHPPAALNIPVVLPNPAIRRMTPNPDFLPTAEAAIPKDAKIIVGCMSGGRSQYAAEVLADAGYQNVANMQGGFGGARDQMGRLLVPGWQDCGLPEEGGDGGARSYEALSRKSTG
jgi:rhodanese-related sulfurtransferase